MRHRRLRGGTGGGAGAARLIVACAGRGWRGGGAPWQNGRRVQGVPVISILGILSGFIVASISLLGYGGIVGLMAIESACIPLPSEIIMPFAGYLASTGRFDLTLVATAGAIGCNLGSTAAYAVGFFGGRPAIERWGRYVWFERHELARTEAFFVRFGSLTVLIGRMLPVVRTFIALPAGIARMPMGRFQLYTFIGSWPWCFGLAYVGYRLGRAWDNDPQLRAVLHRMDLAIVLLLLAGAGWWVWRARRRFRGPRPPQP